MHGVKYTAQQYKEMTGHEPIEDNLERLNCNKTGELGHFHCGYCEKHQKPRHNCGCWISNDIVTTAKQS